MPAVWKCSCGWETDEVDPYGWLGWWSKAMGHQYNVHGNKTDGDGHYIRGLFDKDTGEQITEGLARADARVYFGNDGKKGGQIDNHKRKGPAKANTPDSDTEQKPTPVTASQYVATNPTSQKGTKKQTGSGGAVNPTNIKGVVQGWQIPIPAPAMAYFSLARKHIQDDDNNPYEFTPEGFAKYIQDVYFHWHEDNIAIVLFGDEGIKLLQDARAAATMDKVVQEISGMTPQRDEIKELIAKMMNIDDSTIPGMEIAATVG